MNKLFTQFVEFSEKHNLLHGIQNVVVCVSGGVDSMVMLSLLLVLREKCNINLVASHFNHKLRGVLADEDEQLVIDYCKGNNVKLYRKQLDVRKYAKSNNISLEMAGRKLRYNFYQEIASQLNNSVIATGHTLDDHAETVLLRIFKGTGLQGLEGIPIKRDNIIRPIRFARKSDLYSYAREHNIPFSEDHTNYEENCQRNVIRNSIIPRIIENINPGLVESVANMSQILSEVNEFVTEMVKKALNEVVLEETPCQIILEISRLKNYFINVEKEVLRQCVFRIKKEFKPIGFKTMNNLISLINSNETGKLLRLSGDLYANIDRGRLILSSKEFNDWCEIIVKPGKTYKTKSFVFSSEVLPVTEYTKQPNRSNVEFIDLDKTSGNMKLRRWRLGDRIKPLGFEHSKKLSDLFVDLKVPRIRKDRVPILVCNDEIIWVCGLKLSDLFKISSETTSILKLSYEEI